MSALADNPKVDHKFDITRELGYDETMTYEQKRTVLKLGKWKSALLMFQGAVGLSLFTLQKPLQMTGILWGLFLTALTGYITGFGLVLISNLSSEIESDVGSAGKLKNFDELTNHMTGSYVGLVKWMMMISGVFMMYASSVSNILLVTNHLGATFGLSENLLKLVIFVCIAAILVFLVEPEKIQHINSYMVALLMFIAYSFLAKNIYTAAVGQGPNLADIPLISPKNSGVLMGNVAYAFEVASNYLSLRLTASNEVLYSSLTSVLMIFVGINYYVSAAGFLIAYKAQDIKENAFTMQSGVFQYMIYLFLVNTIYTFTFNTIFTGEIFETIPPVHKLITNHNGEISRLKITAMRIGLWGIAVMFSIFMKDIIYILNFSGSVFTPIISYFGPVFLYYSYMKQKGATVPTWRKIHDSLYVLVAIAVSALGIISAFK